MRILGVDLSLSATGVANGQALWTIRPKVSGAPRLAGIRDAVLLAASTIPDVAGELGEADLVVLEGYSYGSANASHQLGELGGVVRVALHEEGFPVAVVQPSCLKRYATGNGAANKLQVALAAQERLGVRPADDNQADAAFLRAMACDQYGVPVAGAKVAPARAGQGGLAAAGRAGGGVSAAAGGWRPAAELVDAVESGRLLQPRAARSLQVVTPARRAAVALALHLMREVQTGRAEVGDLDHAAEALAAAFAETPPEARGPRPEARGPRPSGPRAEVVLREL